MIRSLLILFALASSAYAETSIDGPTKADAGSLVVLRVKSDIAKPTYVWIAGEFDYEEFEDGAALAFATIKPGVYHFTLVVIDVDAAGKVSKTRRKHRVEVVGVPPPGPTPPGPTPPPVPPTPPTPSEFGLREIALATAPTQNREAVGNNYRNVASMAAAGALPTVDAMNAETKRRNQASVGVNSAAWGPFATAVQKRLGELYEAGKLTTVADHARAWREVGEALDPPGAWRDE